MTELRQLFRQEMRALQEEGSSFAKDFPEAARFLEVEKLDDRDPYVERLTEGFALLTARIREAMEVEQDGLTQHLLEVVAPDLEQALPSIAVIEFDPRSDFAERFVLDAGTTILAAGAPGGVSCPFRLTHPVAIEPVAIKSARVEAIDAQDCILEIELAKTSQDKKRPWPSSMPLYLHGDLPVVWAIRFALLRRCAKIQFFAGGSWDDAREIFMDRLDQPGYSSEYEIPSPLAHMRDYLCSDERFRFLSLRGLESFSGHPSLRLRFCFSGGLPRGMARAVTKDLFRLNTGLAVNRFVDSCQALAWEHTQSVMTLQAFGGKQREILDVVAVEGLTASQPLRRISYSKFSSYRQSTGGAHFQLVRSVNRHGEKLVGISLGTKDVSQEPECQYLAIQAICSDGDVPHQSGLPGGFEKIVLARPPRVTINGLTRPTQSFRPPEGVDSRSRLLAFASGHFDGWLDAARIKDALRHLMWDPAESKRTLIEAIMDVKTEMGHVLVKGVPWRQMIATIRLRDTTCTPDTWDRLGVIDAFAFALFQIVRAETPIGSRTKMRIQIDPAGVELEWES